MTKADDVHKKFIREILNEGTWDEDPRPKYSDGTDAHTKFITQAYEEYDISRGELPITTLRPMGWKSAINELLAIYQTQTNTQKGFESHDCEWWKPWMNDDGNIGRAYSYNLESHRPNEMNREVVEVKRITIDSKYGELKELGLISDIEESIDGITYMEDSESPFIITNNRVEKTKNGTYKYEIQFVKTGNKKEIRGNDLNQSIKHNRSIKDNYSRSYYHLGFLGNYKSLANFKDEHLKVLINKWESMFKRCYGIQSETNKRNYQDRGIFIHQNWHSLEQFLKDVRHLPQYHLAKEDDFEGWDLDKDYFGSNCYSSDTCVFIKHQENTVYAMSKSISIKDKSNGTRKIFLELSNASDYIGVSQSALKTALYRGRLDNGIYSDYIFDYVSDSEDTLYRYELSRNQINELIKDLERNSYSRRHMLSFYNWSNQDKKMLVECAFQSLISVRNVNGVKYLDWTLIMRSSDYLVASSINMIQYVALQMMVAHECGYKVGKFARFTQNLHIYDRHFEQANELLNREGQSTEPTLILKAEGKSFYDITIDDFELANYHPIRPQLKFDLGI